MLFCCNIPNIRLSFPVSSLYLLAWRQMTMQGDTVYPVSYCDVSRLPTVHLAIWGSKHLIEIGVSDVTLPLPQLSLTTGRNRCAVASTFTRQRSTSLAHFIVAEIHAHQNLLWHMLCLREISVRYNIYRQTGWQKVDR